MTACRYKQKRDYLNNKIDLIKYSKNNLIFKIRPLINFLTKIKQNCCVQHFDSPLQKLSKRKLSREDQEMVYSAVAVAAAVFAF